MRVALRICGSNCADECEQGIRCEIAVFALRARNVNKRGESDFARTLRQRRCARATHNEEMPWLHAYQVLERPEDVWIATSCAEENGSRVSEIQRLRSELER